MLCDGEDPDLPAAVKKTVRAILHFDSAQRKEEACCIGLYVHGLAVD